VAGGTGLFYASEYRVQETAAGKEVRSIILLLCFNDSIIIKLNIVIICSFILLMILLTNFICRLLKLVLNIIDKFYL